jgi:hypothetical protein
MCWDRADRREITGLRSGIWKSMGLRDGVERGIGPLYRVEGNGFVYVILQVFRDAEWERTVLAKKVVNLKLKR